MAAGAAASAAAASERPWTVVCTFDAADVSFSDAHISQVDTNRTAEEAHADRATVFLEHNGVRARVRAHVTAPVDVELTTADFGWASLSLRAGVSLGGVVTASQPGIARVVGMGRDGRTIDVAAGGMVVHGLPLRCEDLIAVKSRRSWLESGATHLASGVKRIHAKPGGPGFAVEASPELAVTVFERPRGEWTPISHTGSSDGGGFEIGGWVRAPRLRPSGGGGGGALAERGFRSCAPGTPAEMGFATLAAGIPIFGAAEGGHVWARLTTPTRALVAVYPTGRVALAGLPGWSWPRWQCETGWLDANTVRIDASGAPKPGGAEAGVAK